MAAIIDGSSYPKYWKITPDESTPAVYLTYPKGSLYFDSSASTLHLLADTAKANPICSTDGAKNEHGTVLSDKSDVIAYLHANDK